MKSFRWIALCVLIVFLLLAQMACDCDSSDDDDDDNDDAADDDDDNDDSGSDWPPDNDHIEQGKQYLQASAAGLAREQFLLALNDVPGHPDAYYGLVLANSLHELDVVSIIMAYVEMFLGFQEPEKSDEDPSLQDLLDELLEQVMDGLIYVRHEQLMEAYGLWLAHMPDREFELEAMPIVLNFDTVAQPGGLFDTTEVTAAAALSQILAGLIHHLTSLNVDLDLGAVFYLMDIDFNAYSTQEVLSIVVDILLGLLNDPGHPEFLTFGAQGIDEVKLGGLTAGLGFLAAHETILAMRDDLGDQEVLGTLDENGNGTWEIGEPYQVPPYGSLDDDQTEMLYEFDQLFLSLASSFLDYTPYDPNPDQVTPVNLSVFNVLLRAFGLPSLIPDWDFLTVDFGAMYVDPDVDFIRNELTRILNLMAAFLPPPPPY